MKVLFLLSCLEPAGSETYCTSLANAWKGRHELFWISDQLHQEQEYISMPIHAKAFPIGVINTFRVASFIRRNGIQIIHSHSRRAHWVAAQASKITGIPHVTTIHQPPPKHFFSTLFPCLGDETIAIDEVVASSLMRDFHGDSKHIHLIRNGIDLEKSVPTARHAPNIKQIAIIGRLSGGRWAAFRFFLDVLERTASTLPPAHYKIIGQVPPEHRGDIERLLIALRTRIAPSTIEVWGFVKDLDALIRNVDGAIAAGRSALECMAQGRPVILLGEGGILGLRRPEIWANALRTNLGDHMNPKEFVPARLELGLREILSPRLNEGELSTWGRTQVEKYFDIKTIANQVDQVYRIAMRH